MTPISRTRRFLSVQSHVVSGYCGNKSATFPLQVLGFEVDVINTVQLSNHTQYKLTRGHIFKSQDLDELHFGLKSNDLLQLYDHILSGYVADVSYIKSLAALIKDTKLERKNHRLDCWYTLDPVLGDDGVGYYVPKGVEIGKVYKEYLIPLADIITPNKFEASILSGVEIDSSSDKVLDQAVEAMKCFHKMGVQIVVITSMEAVTDPGKLVCVLSHDPKAKSRSAEGAEGDQTWIEQPSVWTIKVPKLNCPFTGTGDLFTALLSGWLQKTEFDLEKSFENTANSIHEILEDTLEWFKLENNGSVQSHELRLVQNLANITSPKQIRFKCHQVDVRT